MDQPTRLKIHARGIVQGVGFRPFVYQLAKRFHLTGTVKNTGDGVEIVVQGIRHDEFLAALRHDATNPAQHLTLNITALPLQPNVTAFTILPSTSDAANTYLPADMPPCRACLQELFDRHSRYYRYPFINCSHCGPRYTTTTELPYDRHNTVMSAFTLCISCQTSYNDPADRRFHAQATACAHCGPRLSHSIDEILSSLRAGKIVALKGIGGFHLLCDAHNNDAVALLRQRKNRSSKPLAIMVANVASAAQWVEVDEHSETLLTSSQRPIVLLKRKCNTPLSALLAPRLNTLGVILPYAPLHYLLFHESDPASLNTAQPAALVVTSANMPGEPIIIDNDEAHQKLANIADLIVTHDRPIHTRCDDSVLRSTTPSPLMLRRARGYLPEAIPLPHDIPPTLALGGHMKNTFCLTRGSEAFLSPHLGDMNNRASILIMEQTLAHMKRLLNIEPERVAHDMHPDFYTTRYAHALGIPSYAIQHHHAHLAAVVAEHGLTNRTLGLALDGFGLGDDGSAWGGELLLLDAASYQRLGHLRPLVMPGGDSATKQPWRMAAGFLHQIGDHQAINERYENYADVARLSQQLNNRINCSVTSSAGRLFDVASSLLNIQHETAFDGQAAMYLESLVDQCETLEGGWHIEHNILDMTPLLKHLLTCDNHTGANRFHGTLINALTEWLLRNCREHAIENVVFAGGCFANAILTAGLSNSLHAHGITCYLSTLAPINDGGLSLGQAWIAGNMATPHT